MTDKYKKQMLYEFSLSNSLDGHDIVKRVIEFVKTLKNIKKAEMKSNNAIDF